MKLLAAATLTPSMGSLASASPLIEFVPGTGRGQTHLGWLQSKHSFSFGGYRDDSKQGFSDLWVINEDVIQPGTGFGKHPHRDVEIFTYVLEGALAHKDSLGNGSTIRVNDVQLMSAGTGVFHSEYNASAEMPAHFLQIWLKTGSPAAEPRYEQASFSREEKQGKLRLIISERGEQGSLRILQDARVYAGLFDKDESADIQISQGRCAYLHVARGSIEAGGIRLTAGDALKIRGAGGVVVRAGQDAEILLFDLRGE